MAVPEELFAREEAALLRVWRQAEARLRRVLGNVKATTFQRGRARALLSQVEAIMRDLQSETENWLDRTLPKAFEAGFNWTGSGLNPGDFGVFGTIPRQAVEVVASSIANDARQALASVAPNVERVFISSQQAIVREVQVMEMVAQELIAGQGPRVLARNLVATLRDGALKRLEGAAEGAVTDELKEQLRQTAAGRHISIVCRDGKTRRYNLRDYSETIARTSTRMAQTEGTLVSAQQLGVTLVQWSVHANPCLAVCAPLQGKIFAIGTHPDFPTLTDASRPPGHPKCVPPGTPITTIGGPLPIEQLQEGDLVLTHVGRFRPITATMSSHFSGQLVGLDGVFATPDHPVLTERGWRPAGEFHRAQQRGNEGRDGSLIRDSHDAPSRAEQCLISRSVPLTSSGVVVRPPVNLQVDLTPEKGKIENISAERILKLQRIPPSEERPHGDSLIAGRCLPPLSGERAANLLSYLWHAAGIIGLHPREIGLIGRMIRIADAIGASCWSTRNPHAVEMAKYGMHTTRLKAEFGGQLPEGSAFIQVSPLQILSERLSKVLAQFLFYAPAPCLLAAGEGASLPLRLHAPSANGTGNKRVDSWSSKHEDIIACAESLVKPKVTLKKYDGTVYNISVAEDESYVAGDIVMHNCKHVLLPAPESFLHSRGVYDTLKDFSNSDATDADAYGYRDLLKPARDAAREAARQAA